MSFRSSDISNELKTMGLSAEDQLDILAFLIKEHHMLAALRSTKSAIREIFVMRLLRQLRSS